VSRRPRPPLPLALPSSLLLSLLLAAVAAPRAAAQACLAQPGASAGRLNLSAAGGASTGARSYGARLGATVGRGFGGASVSRPKSTDASWATSYALDLGFTLPRNPYKVVAICPVVQAWYQDGPSVPFGSAPVRYQRRGAFIGFAFGDSATIPGFSITPFYEAGLMQLWTTRTRRARVLRESVTAASASGGVALRFGARVLVAPEFIIPIGLPGGDPYLSVRVSSALPGW
jgi:hypothetical protein